MTAQFNAPQMVGAHPRIAVIGVGGGGCNAINGMVQGQLGGVEFIAANTDLQDLHHTQADCRIQLGAELTGGYGAGTDPEIGNKAAEESISDIRAALSGVALAFVAAGMGGGTGTGAVPVIARVARELDILTVGVITKPFEFEGQSRMAVAERGVEESGRYLDTSIVIANQNLFSERGRSLRLSDAFQEVDTVLYEAIRGVIDLVVRPGIINMDFADLSTVLRDGGVGVIGAGEAEGEGRGQVAAAAAATNPLLDGITLNGAATLLVNVTGGDDLDMTDFNDAANFLRARAREDARVKVGAASDPEMEGRVRVYVVASGLGEYYQTAEQPVGRGHWRMPERPQIPTSITAPPRPRTLTPFSGGRPRLGSPRNQPPARSAPPAPSTVPMRTRPEASNTEARPRVTRPSPDPLWGDNDVQIDRGSIRSVNEDTGVGGGRIDQAAGQEGQANANSRDLDPQILRGNSVVAIGAHVHRSGSAKSTAAPLDEHPHVGATPTVNARGLIRRIRASG